MTTIRTMLGALLASFSLATAAAAEFGVTLRSSSTDPNRYPTVAAVKHLGDFLKLRSDGWICVGVFYSGRFRFSIDGTEFKVGPADSCVTSSNAVHDRTFFEDGALIDCFTPRRDDFL
ncbi:hypothetical protein SAMN04488515_3247 [Cognatiyoonia koreensis]|uniref:Beta/Gamma crystallin n=1 Tax=Cognatiyoonia koreensis TaxID=364200 RepID=A0A1I0RUB3_9RHOB|nr:cupin [Cognatiyoonia koreensis]SEW44821.1 hypothetical protein SAMN04488515_3247 [Cognatiyoonia koreensis]